ncbi:MAG TPA: glycosyltransferase family 4 protein [Acetobacteraceae bacterium]
MYSQQDTSQPDVKSETAAAVPLRILVASNFYPPHIVGGAEIVAERHARELARRGHSVMAIGGSIPAPGRPAGSLEPEGQQSGVDVQRLALRSLEPDDSFRWPTLARRISAFVAMRGIDVVHLHNLVGLGVDAILAAKAAGTRCVVTLHDYWGFCLRQSLSRPNGTVCGDFEACAGCRRSFVHEGETLPIRLRRDYVAWCLEQADVLLAPSAYLADAYHRAGVAPNRIEVLSNGLDLDAIPPPAQRNDGVVRFVCSATLAPHKGIPVLLEAVERLAGEAGLDGRWQVLLAGDGPLRDEADVLAAKLAGTAPLVVTGHLPRPTLLAHMAEADVVLLPSIWPENEPVSLLEGIASGAALLVTGIGGSPHLARDGETGLEVPPGDAGALAEAMRQLITEDGLAARMGAVNRARRTTLDEAATVDRLEVIYRAGQGRPAAPEQDTAPIVLVGRGSAPEPIIDLVGQLYGHLASRPGPRFLRHDWVPEAAWAQASLLWLWDKKDAESTALAALRRDIAILAPAGIGLEHWIGAGAPVLTYRTPMAALAALQVLLDRPGICAHMVAETSVAAEAVWAAPRAAFALRARGPG